MSNALLLVRCSLIFWTMRCFAHFPAELLWDGWDRWNGVFCGFKDPLHVCRFGTRFLLSSVEVVFGARTREGYNGMIWWWQLYCPLGGWLPVDSFGNAFWRTSWDLLLVSGKLNWKSMKDRYYPADWLHLAQGSRWSDWANLTCVAAN